MKKLFFSMAVVSCLTMLSGTAWCNGTVTVNGLVWLKDAGCLGKMSWRKATERAKTLADGQCGLTDNSKAGDWRLPTVAELQGVASSKSQFKNVGRSNWASSICPSNTAYCYVMDDVLVREDVTYIDLGLYVNAWPVRTLHQAR